MKKACYSIITVPLFCLALSFQGSAQQLFRFSYPFAQSPKTGAEIHLFGNYVWSALDNVLIPSTLFNENTAKGKTLNVLSRLGKLATYEFYLTYLQVVHQHEYFGHLARAKQFEAGFTRFEIFYFPPKGGAAYWGNHLYHPLTANERSFEFMAGLESNSLLAERTVQKILQTNSVPFQMSMLFIAAKTDLARYLLFEKHGSLNDIENYLFLVNQSQLETKIDRIDLLTFSCLAIVANPIVWRSVYHLFFKYLLKGEVYTNYMSKSDHGLVRFLPYYSFELQPSQPFHHFGFWMQHNRVNYHSVFRAQAFNRKKNFGLELGVFGIPLVNDNLFMDIETDLWKAEKIEYHNHDGESVFTPATGFRITTNLFFVVPHRSIAKHRLLATIGLGYKLGGYSRGYPLHEGMLINVGFGLQMLSTSTI